MNKNRFKKYSKFRKNKRAIFFGPMILLFTILILTYSFIRLSNKMDAVTEEIGINQLEAVAMIQEGEKALLFLDFAAKMSIYQAVYDLQQRGGISDSSTCGTYYGFNKWNSEQGQNCIVNTDNAKTALQNIFVSNVVSRMAGHPTADFAAQIPESQALRQVVVTSGSDPLVSSSSTSTTSRSLQQTQDATSSQTQTSSRRDAGPMPTGAIHGTALEDPEIKTRLVAAIEAVGAPSPNAEGLGRPGCCGFWMALVYKWMGYGYSVANTDKRYSSLQEMANDQGYYPIAFADDRGSAGHTLILLGFGSDAGWWLDRFSNVEVKPRTHERSVGEDEALMMSFYGSSTNKVFFNIYKKDLYLENILNTRTGESTQIIAVRPWVPLCEGQYRQESRRSKVRYEGQWYWSNNEPWGARPWGVYWEPQSSPYYPLGGDCSRVEVYNPSR